MREQFSGFARAVNFFCASPQATALAFAIVAVWAATGPAFHYSDGWQLFINTGTTIVTFLMVFVLNNAQARDTRAVQIKLDGILHAIDAADNRLIRAEHKPEDVLEAIHAELCEAEDLGT